MAEFPGHDENDLAVKFANGVLAIKGEKETETKGKDRLLDERCYGRFERRIPVEDVDEEKVSAAFKNGALTVTMPKTPQAQSESEAHRHQPQMIKGSRTPSASH
jgi:HSP20 family protein